MKMVALVSYSRGGILDIPIRMTKEKRTEEVLHSTISVLIAISSI